MTRYFAYGHNMANPALLERPGVRSLGRASVPDHRLRFGRASIRWQAGAADVVPAPGRTVWGELVEVDDDALVFLDTKEGVDRGWYRRTTLPVRDGGAALTYVVVEPAAVEQVPRAEYLRGMVAAARALGFPAGYRNFLEGLLAQVRAGARPGQFRATNDTTGDRDERY